MDTFASACNTSFSGTPGLAFTHLINTLFAAQCGLVVSGDYPADYGDKLNNGDEFDFIVIGAGKSLNLY